MPISDRLDRIEARTEAATEGPWKIETHYGMSQSRRRQIVVPGWMTPIAVLGKENPYGDADAEFIAASREDVPELVAAVRRRDAVLHAVLELHQPGHRVHNWATGPRTEAPCPDCHGKAGVHPCGCWADYDTEFTCRECSTEYDTVSWPCRTYTVITTALGEEA